MQSFYNANKLSRRRFFAKLLSTLKKFLAAESPASRTNSVSRNGIFLKISFKDHIQPAKSYKCRFFSKWIISKKSTQG
jgi:hypothetical protein